MKIEMGESIFYTWLRHIKKCQLVQTNWKASKSWDTYDQPELESFMGSARELFLKKHNYDVFKNNSFLQLIKQAEVDALGISFSDNDMRIFAVDVAYHENGLIYVNQMITVYTVIKKFLRTAICLRYLFNMNNGDIIFASPKVTPKVMSGLVSAIEEINALFFNSGFGFSASLYANNDFNKYVLKPIFAISEDVADTSEMFLRSYQLIKMFDVK